MSLTSLSTEIIFQIRDHLTDPLDLHSLRLTNHFFNIIVTPRFTTRFPPYFQFTVAYHTLISRVIVPSDPPPSTDFVPVRLNHGQFLQHCHDALIHHAATRNHTRHLEMLIRQPYPPAWRVRRDGKRRQIPWKGYKHAVCAAQQNEWWEVLIVLLEEAPTERIERWNGWVLSTSR